MNGSPGCEFRVLEVSASLGQVSGSNKDRVIKGERVGIRVWAKNGWLRCRETLDEEEYSHSSGSMGESVPGYLWIPKSLDAQVLGVVQWALPVRVCATCDFK